jgi:hypothetical protein
MAASRSARASSASCSVGAHVAARRPGQVAGEGRELEGRDAGAGHAGHVPGEARGGRRPVVPGEPGHDDGRSKPDHEHDREGPCRPSTHWPGLRRGAREPSPSAWAEAGRVRNMPGAYAPEHCAVITRQHRWPGWRFRAAWPAMPPIFRANMCAQVACGKRVPNASPGRSRRPAEPCGRGRRDRCRGSGFDALRRDSSLDADTCGAACHAGGRGFESRRSRLTSPLHAQGFRFCGARAARRGRAASALNVQA